MCSSTQLLVARCWRLRARLLARRMATHTYSFQLSHRDLPATLPLQIAPDAAPRGGQISDSPDVELLPPESETGNVEYKLKLVNIPPSRFQHLVRPGRAARPRRSHFAPGHLASSQAQRERAGLPAGRGPRLAASLTTGLHDTLREQVSQLLFRLSEGAGEAVYKIGVTDGGFPQGLSDAELQASIWTVRQMAEQLRCTCASVGVRPGVSGRWAEVRVVHVIAHALACPVRPGRGLRARTNSAWAGGSPARSS